MQASTWMKAPRQRLIDTITLLWTLNEIPDIPRINPLPDDFDATRQLTIERETDIADNFAFLSATTDDMHKVMAVCIEEDLDQEGLTIRVASNTGSLAETENRFKNITQVLEQAALRG